MCVAFAKNRTNLRIFGLGYLVKAMDRIVNRVSTVSEEENIPPKAAGERSETARRLLSERLGRPRATSD